MLLIRVCECVCVCVRACVCVCVCACCLLPCAVGTPALFSFWDAAVDEMYPLCCAAAPSIKYCKRCPSSDMLLHCCTAALKSTVAARVSPHIPVIQNCWACPTARRTFYFCHIRLHDRTRVSVKKLQDVPVSRKTKIVCTLGPACWSESGLKSLLDAGMNVARFNFSHGTHEAHQEVLDRLRKVRCALARVCAFVRRANRSYVTG